ncbi:MAG TPA: peroxiredoxin [Candidatus Acidoferrum sp.]|nr:peroxiredoxin [Candidatus Acidoferrum sp.]
MKKLLLSTLIASAIAVPTAWAALDKGADAPMFKTKASLNGAAFDYSLKDSVAKGPTIVYFYPSAFTGGCNAQAHAFAENMDKIKAAGASVVGVSLDSIQRLNDFSKDPEYCAGKLPVASDADGSIAKSYGLDVRDGRAGMKDTRGVEIDHGFTSRTTFIVGKDGKIAETISADGKMAPVDNVNAALAIVEKMKK